ncbi:MAG: 3-dehydroquinate synthase [Myxococcales bacterium]|nr:3-dehydroquinate synthase [Myxococcales bacterium]
MRVFLSGPMGSGKSTIARLLGERLGLAVIDLDERIQARASRSVAEIFADSGEAAFRHLEADVLGELLADTQDAIVSLGGGTVTVPELRHRLLFEGTLVTLDADLDVLVRRVGSGKGRPLLAGQDIRARLTALLAQRAEAYAECHARVDTGRLSVQQAVETVADLAGREMITVPLGRRTYPVEVGSGVRHRIVEFLAGRRVVLVTDENVGPRWGVNIADTLRNAGSDVALVTLPAGEAHKHVRSVEAIWDQALSAGVDRHAFVVAVGGGVVGDLAGFAAATLLRGVAVGHVPTSLLAMVDSSVGGKTGFDTRQGKNLVGAFHQPSFVLADVDVLETLPDAERVAGLAEVVKSAWIEGESEVSALERDAEALRAGEPQATSDAIRMACRMKARVVTLDEREAGLRAILNLGHTVGHAIEAAQDYRLRHGECVALGMVAACRLSVRLARMAAQDADRMTALLHRLGLPTDVTPHLTDRTLSFLSADKKRSGDAVRYVLPGAPGDIELRKLPLRELASLLRM